MAGRLKAKTASLLALVVLATMFLAVESSVCVSVTRLTGACETSSVDVESKSDTITATLEIKEGNDTFDGSVTIGNCVINGRFVTAAQAFKLSSELPGYFSPISIVATARKVTLEGFGQASGTRVCSFPFKLEDGKAKTTIKLESRTTNVISLELGKSVVITKVNEEKKWPWWAWTLLIVAIVLVVLLLIGTIVGTVLCYRCKKRNKKIKELEYTVKVAKGKKKKSSKQAVGLAKSKVEEKKEVTLKDQKEKSKTGKEKVEIQKQKYKAQKKESNRLKLNVSPKKKSFMKSFKKFIEPALESLSLKTARYDFTGPLDLALTENWQWPTGHYTLEQVEQLMEWFPVEHMEHDQIVDNLRAFLEKHPLNQQRFNALGVEGVYWIELGIKIDESKNICPPECIEYLRGWILIELWDFYEKNFGRPEPETARSHIEVTARSI
ncbi:hypothetical protein M3Y98_00766800 [Aphelenchoides besseyi]|nr:hypothetical protein M3Y98_00766800 [Aphelenchoides besseyi]